MAPTKTELIDLGWRALWTFISTFLSGLTMAGTGIIDISARNVALLSAGGAVASLIKTYTSNKLGTGTATTRETPVVGPAPVASVIATPVD